MQLNLLATPTLPEIIAVIISVLALAVSIWTAWSTKKQADATSNHYQLALEQYRRTLFSNVIVYLPENKYDLKDRQLALCVTNTGQVPVSKIQVNVFQSGSSEPVHSSTIHILFHQNTETVFIGESIYSFLERLKVVNFSSVDYDIQVDKPIVFTIEIVWTPAIPNPSGIDKMQLRLILNKDNTLSWEGSSIFNVALEEL